VEFAHRFAHAYELVWQFNTEDPASLDGQVSRLAKLLGVLDGADSEASDLVREYLASRERPWLLVLDNVVDPEVVQRLVPGIGHGHVIVTTQRTDWPLGTATEVPVLARDVAIEFVLSHAHEASADEAGRLGDALGCLPLALAQAAAFLRSSGRSVEHYLGLLSSDRARILAGVGSGKLGKAVAGAWAAATAQLGGEGSAPLALLRLLAFYAPDAIPVHLLIPDGFTVPVGLDPQVTTQLGKLSGGRLSLDEALIALREYSLISPPVHGAVSIHRLVQATTQDALDADQLAAWRHAAAVLVVAALPTNPEMPDSWPEFAALLPHAEAALPAGHDGLLRVATYLGSSGSYRAALASAQRVANAREQEVGLHHPNSLAALHEVSRWTGASGERAAARDQLAELLPLFEQAQGPEHPTTLTTRHSLAYWTGRAGDPAAARDQLIALLPIQERVLGSEHPEVLETRHNRAFWTGMAGDPADARAQLTALLPIRERVQGPDDPHTLNGRLGLAHWTGEAGDASAARDQLAALVPIRERVQGPEHPVTLTSRHNLAYWTGMAGDPAAARDQFAALLPILEEVQGPRHPNTLSARDQLSRWSAEANALDSSSSTELETPPEDG